MRKPVSAIYEQQRRRSACVSVESDQPSLLFTAQIVQYIYLLYPEFQDSVAEQAGLNLSWSETLKTVFLFVFFFFRDVVHFKHTPSQQ